MPDFGVDSELLASLKQGMYVAGIGGQIDSGAWERLEPEKRVIGFDHNFLWIQGLHAVLGQLWSSTDRKGRSKYPMVACIHLRNLQLESLLETPRLLLDQVRDGCKNTTSANHVVISCQAAQDQLNRWVTSKPALATISVEEKQRFLRAPAFQPDMLGLLRVLHELDNAIGAHLSGSAQARKTDGWQSSHIRVPLAAESAERGLLLWASFLRCALPETVPLLLIVRQQTDWLDVVIGNPAGSSLFCLQASLSALPMATAIPYDIAPSLTTRLQTITRNFLGEAAIAEVKGSSGEPRTNFREPVASAQAPAERDRGRAALPLGLGALVLLCLAVGVWYASNKKAPSSEGAAKPVPLSSTKDSAHLLTASQAAQARGEWPLAHELLSQVLKKAQESNDLSLKQQTERELAFVQSMSEAANALREDQPEPARQLIERVLQQRPGDPAALALQTQIDERIEQTAKLGEFQQLMQRAQKAEADEQWAQAVEVLTQASLCASTLKDTKHGKVAASELSYVRKMDAAQTALKQGNYAEAGKQADAALALKSKDVRASKIKAEAQEAQQYQDVMKAAQTAFDQQEYAEAIRRADEALRIRPKAAEATRLKQQAQQEQGYEGVMTAFKRGDYQGALSQCRQFQGTERFDQLGQKIGQEQNQLQGLQKAFNEGSYPDILGIVLPDKPGFTNIRAGAVEENRVLEQARAKLARGEYDYIETIERQSYKAKPPFVTILEAGRKGREGRKPPVTVTTVDSVKGNDQSSGTSALVERNDVKLQHWENLFGLRSGPEKPVNRTKDSEYNLLQFDKVEAEYLASGALTAERKRRINSLRWVVSEGKKGEPPVSQK